MIHLSWLFPPNQTFGVRPRPAQAWVWSPFDPALPEWPAILALDSPAWPAFVNGWLIDWWQYQSSPQSQSSLASPGHSQNTLWLCVRVAHVWIMLCIVAFPIQKYMKEWIVPTVWHWWCHSIYKESTVLESAIWLVADDGKEIWTDELVTEGNRCSCADTLKWAHIQPHNNTHSLNPLGAYKSTYSGSTWLMSAADPALMLLPFHTASWCIFERTVMKRMQCAMHGACRCESNTHTVCRTLPFLSAQLAGVNPRICSESGSTF